MLDNVLLKALGQGYVHCPDDAHDVSHAGNKLGHLCGGRDVRHAVSVAVAGTFLDVKMVERVQVVSRA